MALTAPAAESTSWLSHRATNPSAGRTQERRENAAEKKGKREEEEELSSREGRQGGGGEAGDRTGADGDMKEGQTSEASSAAFNLQHNTDTLGRMSHANLIGDAIMRL